ncbi:MAG: MBL fold metallo-hydrolase [Clostridiales bacterium]|nr:MBL fold metallo-hydrolase [Clostridiales bacterium]
MPKLKINHYVVGSVQTNCYFAINEETDEAIIIDPGAAAEQLSECIKKDNLKPVAIILTHGHFDHAGAAEELAQRYGIKIYAHEDDEETLKIPEMNVSTLTGVPETYHADEFFEDNQEIELAGFKIKVLHTPGHTPGGCCYYFPEEGVVFSGDSLFCHSIGRTDFPKGSESQLVRAVKDKLMTLPDGTRVYPGHDSETTIADERMYNPYL